MLFSNQSARFLCFGRSPSLKTGSHFVPSRLEQVKMDIKGTVPRDFLLQIFHEFTANVVDIGATTGVIDTGGKFAVSMTPCNTGYKIYRQ